MPRIIKVQPQREKLKSISSAMPSVFQDLLHRLHTLEIPLEEPEISFVEGGEQLVVEEGRV